MAFVSIEYTLPIAAKVFVATIGLRPAHFFLLRPILEILFTGNRYLTATAESSWHLQYFFETRLTKQVSIRNLQSFLQRPFAVETKDIEAVGFTRGPGVNSSFRLGFRSTGSGLIGFQKGAYQLYEVGEEWCSHYNGG